MKGLMKTINYRIIWLKMKVTLKKMKGEMELLNAKVNKKIHEKQLEQIDELEDIISRYDGEIIDIKTEFIDVLEEIERLCFSNTYNGRYDSFKRIDEIVKDNIKALKIDLDIEKRSDDCKIIELPKTDQSAR